MVPEASAGQTGDAPVPGGQAARASPLVRADNALRRELARE